MKKTQSLKQNTHTKYKQKRSRPKKNSTNQHYHKTVHDKPLVPVFVIVYNRIWCLEKCLQSLAHLGQPVILLNNGSDYPPFIEWIEKMRDRYEVIDMNKVDNTQQLYANVRNGIHAWKQKHGKPIDAYILTDPDIELENSKMPWIHTLLQCLRKHKNITAVGPNLRTDDIPDFYPLKQKTLRDEAKNHINDWFTWKNVRMKHSRIDTTFAMYRMDHEKVGFEKKALRTDAPYCARHLDWYIHPAKLTSDQIHYFQASKNITHYGGHMIGKIIMKREKCARQRIQKIQRRHPKQLHTITTRRRIKHKLKKITKHKLLIKMNRHTRKRIARKIENIIVQCNT